jgi:hypothetical protein
MQIEDIPSWQFTSAEAAGILGWSEPQFAGWVKRYSPFPQKKLGRGHSTYYDLPDLFKLAAISHLVAAGLPPEKAFAALAPYRSPYGRILNDVPRHTYPGTMMFTQNSDGRWVSADSPDFPVAIEVRAWPIFDEIFPRVKQAILASPRNQPLPEIKKAIKEYENKIGQLRRERWGTGTAETAEK